MINRLQSVCQAAVFRINNQRGHWVQSRFCVFYRFDQDKIGGFILVRIDHLEPLGFQMGLLHQVHCLQHLRSRIHHAEFSSALQDPEPAFEKAEQGIVLLIPGNRTFGKRAGKRRARRSIRRIADHRVQAAGRNIFRLLFHIPAADPDP